MKLAIVLTGSLIVLLGACAPQVQPRIVYEKPGVGADQARRDEADCVAAASSAPFPDARIGLMRLNRDEFDACMKARGYRAREVWT